MKVIFITILIYTSNVFAQCKFNQTLELSSLGYEEKLITNICKDLDRAREIINKEIRPITLFRGINTSLDNYKPNYKTLRSNNLLYVAEDISIAITFSQFDGIILKLQVPSDIYKRKDNLPHGTIARDLINDINAFTVSISKVDKAIIQNRYLKRYSKVIDLDKIQDQKSFLRLNNTELLDFFNFKIDYCSTFLNSNK